MENTISESVKVLVAVSNAFEHFNFVVAALGKPVCYRPRKGVQNAVHPVNHTLSALLESFNSTIICRINPFRKGGFSGISIITIKDSQKIFLVKMCGAERWRNIKHSVKEQLINSRFIRKYYNFQNYHYSEKLWVQTDQ